MIQMQSFLFSKQGAFLFIINLLGCGALRRMTSRPESLCGIGRRPQIMLGDDRRFLSLDRHEISVRAPSWYVFPVGAVASRLAHVPTR